MVGNEAEQQIKLLSSQRISRKGIAIPIRGPSRIKPYISHIFQQRVQLLSNPFRAYFRLDLTQGNLQYFRQMNGLPSGGLYYLLSTTKSIRNNQSVWLCLSYCGQQDALPHGH